MNAQLEPTGGNVYRRHLRWNEGVEWRCAHGLTGWSNGEFIGCVECSFDDPIAYLEARAREEGRLRK
jgi:hypothetical protein